MAIGKKPKRPEESILANYPKKKLDRVLGRTKPKRREAAHQKCADALQAAETKGYLRACETLERIVRDPIFYSHIATATDFAKYLRDQEPKK